MRPRSRRWLWVLAVLAATVATILVVARLAVDSLGTSLTRSDFASDDEALSFVSDHLPAPLPPGSRVLELTYERWLDWHMEATVVVSASADAESYLDEARKARATDEAYCGPSDTDGEIVYLLPQWMACGQVKRTSDPAKLQVRCFTR